MTVEISTVVLNEIAQWILMIALIPMVIANSRITHKFMQGLQAWRKDKGNESFLLDPDDPVIKQAVEQHREACKRGDDCGVEKMLKQK